MTDLFKLKTNSVQIVKYCFNFFNINSILLCPVVYTTIFRLVIFPSIKSVIFTVKILLKEVDISSFHRKNPTYAQAKIKLLARQHGVLRER